MNLFLLQGGGARARNPWALIGVTDSVALGPTT